MEAFYLSLLGDHLRSQRPGFVNFEWGHQRLTLTIHSDIDGRAHEPARVMVNLVVDDIDADFAALDDSVPVVRRPEEERWGGRVCTIADPDGNYLQLMQLP